MFDSHVAVRRHILDSHILNGETPIPPGALGRLNANAEGSANEVPGKWVCQGVCKKLAPNLPQEAKRVPKGSQKGTKRELTGHQNVQKGAKREPRGGKKEPSGDQGEPKGAKWS